jgi:ATP phosphoribosyltransferase regulatory subunit
MNRLPHGVRDQLPVAAARRRGLSQALSGEFARWGYRAVITPLYEYEEVLLRGMGAAARAMRFVEPSSGEILAIRPDLTPQIARLVATRLHDEPGPLRLFYEGSVVRNAEELYQVGVELIDAPQPGGDVEAIGLACAALRAAGVGDFALDLGHAAVAHAALSDLGLGEHDEAELHDALAKKDAARAAELADRARIPSKQRQLVAALPSLYGGPEVLARARALVADPTPVDELERLLERLAQLEPGLAPTLDLGEVRGFRYYTGTRFAAYAAGAGGALLQGGRYDQVVERYGRPARATGFAVDVDGVAEVLRQRGAGAVPQEGGVLVAGDPVAAVQLARKLRARGVTVVLDLDEPPADWTKLQKKAADRGLQPLLVGTSSQWATGSGDEAAALDALAANGPRKGPEKG